MTRARELREVFDAGFAAAPPPPEPVHRDVLCIRIAGEPFAIPLGDIASLHADLRIVALPARAPELLGVAALRSAVVPIYDASRAFGLPAADAPRWLVVLRGGRAGFAFDGYDGHARIPDRAITPVDAPANRRGHVRGQLVLDGQPRAIVDLGSVLAAIEQRGRHDDTAKDA
jgi:chemotaxis signal transduction protein